MAHVAGHALAGEYARRERRGADRTLHLEHVTVRLGTAAEAVAANDARETAALGVADDVDELLVVEDVDQDAVAGLGATPLAGNRRLLKRTSLIIATGGTLDLAKWPVMALLTLEALMNST